ncbi:hypothetical protein GQ54DRAFT_204775 [Martensiomyces pterosporus]|nr:hypothetical protein GQ54DRAFT_204775 [Martensiomyces pterosporus]
MVWYMSSRGLNVFTPSSILLSPFLYIHTSCILTAPVFASNNGKYPTTKRLMPFAQLQLSRAMWPTCLCRDVLTRKQAGIPWLLFPNTNTKSTAAMRLLSHTPILNAVATARVTKPVRRVRRECADPSPSQRLGQCLSIHAPSAQACRALHILLTLVSVRVPSAENPPLPCSTVEGRKRWVALYDQRSKRHLPKQGSHQHSQFTWQFPVRTSISDIRISAHRYTPNGLQRHAAAP